MIKKTREHRKIALFCDFHGHSRKKNIFIYGCNDQSDQNILKERVFPLYLNLFLNYIINRLLSRKHSAFSYKDCCFDIQKQREATARVVVHKEFGVENSFTCEASFCGASSGSYSNLHFNPQVYHVKYLFSNNFIGIWS